MKLSTNGILILFFLSLAFSSRGQEEAIPSLRVIPSGEKEVGAGGAMLLTDKAYTLTVADGICSFVSEVNVNRTDRPFVVKIVGETQACLGDVHTFTLQLADDSDYDYSWYKVGSSNSLSTEKAYFIGKTTLQDAGEYYCVVYDRLHDLTAYSDTLELQVSAYPQTTLATATLTPCYEAEVTLNAGYQTTGLSGLTYRWEKNGMAVTGNSAVKKEKINTTSAVHYKVYIDNQGCEDAAEVELLPIVPVVDLPELEKVSIGEPITLTNTFQEGAVYTWDMKDEYTPSATGNEVTFTATPQSDQVILTVDYRGCRQKDTTLLLTSHADREVQVKMLGYTRACVGDSLNYTVFISEISKYAYTWHKLGTDVEVGHSEELIFKEAQESHSGKYYCEVYDQLFDLTFYSDTLDITVSDYAEPAVTLNGKAEAGKKWTFCRGTEVELETAERADTRYWWSGKGIIGGAADRKAKIVVWDSAVYQVRTIHKGCVREDTLTVLASDPQVTLPDKLYRIAGESLTLKAEGGSSDDTYTWNPAGSAHGSEYTFTVREGISRIGVEVENVWHCKAADTVVVVGVPAMNYVNSVNDGYAVSREQLRLRQTDTTVCERTTLALEVEYDGYEGYVYEWMKVGNGQPLDTGCILTFASIADKDKGEYYCRTMSVEEGGYIYSDTVKIGVAYRPQARIDSPFEGEGFCGGSEVILAGVDAAMPSVSNTYAWIGAGIQGGADAPEATATAGANGYYTFVVTRGECSDTAHVSIRAIRHKVDIPSSLILNQPARQLQFTARATGEATYSWYVNGVETGSGSATTLLDIEQPGEVVVKMTQEGCTFRDTCRIMIRDYTPVEKSEGDGFAVSCPVLRVADKEVRVCQDGDADLRVIYMGYERYRYEWLKVGETKVWSDSIVYPIRHALPGQEGFYYCRAFNPDINAYIYSDTLHLTVNSGPVAVINTPAKLQVCYGSVIDLTTPTAYAPGGSSTVPDVADRLVWGGEQIMSGQGSNTVEVKVTGDGRYTLKAIKEDGCSSETSVQLEVIKPEIRIPYVHYLNEAGEVTFAAQTSEPAEVVWSIDGKIAATSADPVKLQLDTTGMVTVQMTTAGSNCVARDTCSVYVKRKITFRGGENDGFILSRPRPYIPTELKDLKVCPNQEVTFRVLHPEYPFFKYQWHKLDGEVIATGKAYTFHVQPGQGGLYYCTVEDPDLPGSRIYSDTLRLTVKEGPLSGIVVLKEGMDYTGRNICPGTTLTLDATSSESGVGGGVTYEWTGEGIETGETATGTIVVTPERTTTYTVRVKGTIGGCEDTASVHFEVFRPTLNLPGRLQLAAPQPRYVFDIPIPDDAEVKWTYVPEKGTGVVGSPIDIGQDGYVYAEITQQGCIGVDSCLVYVKEPATFNGGENDGYHLLESSTVVWLEPLFKEMQICRDNRLELEAKARGLGKYVYLWHQITETDVDLPLEDQTSAALAIDYFDESREGKYYCEVSDIRDVGTSKATYYTDTIHVTLKEGPQARIEIVSGGDGSLRTCFGEKFELKGVNINPAFEGKTLTYSWSGDVFTRLGDEQYIEATPQGNAAYFLKVSDEETGCSDTVRLQFDMHSPKVTVPKHIYLAAPGNVEITALTEGEGELKWYIDYRNTVVSKENPGIIHLQQDAKVIAEIVQDGCSGFDTTQVYVKWPTTFIGGDDDGFVMSALDMKGSVTPKFPQICRGTDIHLRLNVNAEGRVLKYAWMKVGESEILSEEKDLVMRADKMSDAGQYYCQITDPAEEDVRKRTTVSDTAVVTLINGPVAKINVPEDGTTICDGVAIEIDASATENNKVSPNDEYRYEWFGPNITYTGRQYVVKATTAPRAVYVVKATLGECSTSDTIRMNVIRPEIHIPPVLFLPDEQEVTMGVEPMAGSRIRWSYYYDFDQSTQTQWEPKDTVTYTLSEDAHIVVERIAQGCSGYDTCHVFVKDSRGFTGGTEDGFVSSGTAFYIKDIKITDYVCAGEMATLSIVVAGNDYYHYEWRKVGSDRIYSENAVYRIAHVTKEDEGNYYCIVTDVNNRVVLNSDRVFLHVKDRPESSILGTDGKVCVGEEVTLEADQSQLLPDVNYTYLWQGKGITRNVTATTTFRAEESGEYVLVVGDGDCYRTDTLDLIVERVQLEVPAVYQVMQGESLKLQATVNGAPASSLDWKVDGNPYRNTAEVQLTNLTKSVEFSVQTNGTCQIEKTGHIYVRSNAGYAGGYDDGYTLPNNLPQLLEQCDLLLGCNVDTAVLWVNAIKTKDLEYMWQKYSETNQRFEEYKQVPGRDHVTGFKSDTLRFSEITELDEGRYRCRLNNSFGAVYSREIRLVKGGTPQIRVHLTDGAKCEHTDFQLGVTVAVPHRDDVSGVEYNWYFAKDGLNFSQITPAVDYNHPSFTRKDPQEADEGYYMVEVSNYCGVAYDTAFQEVWEAPAFVAQPQEEAVCMGSSITLTTEVEGGGTYGYALWQVEVNNKGEFVRNIRNLYIGVDPAFTIEMAGEIDRGYFRWIAWNDCDTVRSNPFMLKVEDPLIPKFESVDTTICAGVGNNLWLDATGHVADRPASIRFYWEKDGQRIEGANAERYLLRDLKTTDAGVYICYAYHSCQPQPIKQYRVNTQAVPTIVKPIVIDSAYCEGDRPSLLIGYTSDAGEVACSWYHGSDKLTDSDRIDGSLTANLKIDSVIGADAGYYEVRLKNKCGERRSEQVRLVVNLPARYTDYDSLEHQSARLCVGESKELHVSATGLTPIVYTWIKDGQVVQSGTDASYTLKQVKHTDAGEYQCNAQNVCNTEAAVSVARIDVVTPVEYAVEGGGHYCANTGREVTLAGFEKNVLYTLYRRSTVLDTLYTAVMQVRGDTVSTPKLTFGYMEYGLYHVEGVTLGAKSCKALMKGEIEILRDATPEEFDFYISDPMCTGENSAVLTLSGTEENKDITYRIQRYDDDFEDWGPYGATFKGNGEAREWLVREGIYRLMARNTVSGCEIQIGGNDTVTTRPYPAVFELFAVNGDTTACYGIPSDVILQLDGSDPTCTYTLLRDGLSTERTIKGEVVRWDTVRGGNYTVEAATVYGCKKRMGQVEVTDLPRLDRYIFSANSSLVYCEEDEGEEHAIVLGGSTPGIRYDFYSTVAGEPRSSVWGTGKQLIWHVQLTGDSTYYVVAVDTVENCYEEMANRVEIRANHLQIETQSPLQISSSTQTRLPVTIHQAMGEPVVVWEPLAKVAEVDPATHTATTVIMNEGERFKVTVSDSVCTKEGFVDLTVIGEGLKAEIKASDCYTSLDTLYLCRGEQVSLCGFMRGGSGVYRFKWSDDLNDSIPVEQKSKITYPKQEDGFVVLYVESDVLEEGIAVTKQAKDTVWIRFKDLPVAPLAECGALTCALPDETVEIGLSGMEQGVNYWLEYQPAVGMEYEKVEDSEYISSGIDTTYRIVFNDAKAGHYRLQAVKTYPKNSCRLAFPVTELRQAPRHLEIQSLGVTEYCQDTRLDTIRVVASETGADYHLIWDKTTDLKQLAGNGEDLTFVFDNGSKVDGKQIYQVVAVLGACQDTLGNSLQVTSYKRPVTEIEGMKDYCADVDEITLKIAKPFVGAVYTLYEEGKTQAIQKTDAAAYEEIILNIGKSLTSGRYMIVAEAHAGEETAMMCTDTVRGLTVGAAPQELKMLDEPVYCDHLAGWQQPLRFAGADSLVRYELWEGQKEMPDSLLGKFAYGNRDTIFYEHLPAVEAGYSERLYHIYARVGSCHARLNNITLKKQIAPLEKKLIGDTLGCVGTPLYMGTETSEKEVTYILYREHQGRVDSLTQQVGDGSNVVFGAYAEEGTYYVVAWNKGGCDRRLKQVYRIRPIPDKHHLYIAGSASYCEGGAGVELGITYAQQGVMYRLQYRVEEGEEVTWKDVLGGEIAGTDAESVLFPGEHKANTYRIITDHCGVTMLDTLEVTELPLPENVRIEVEGKACLDSAMDIRIRHPEEGTLYTLHFNGQPAEVSPETGNGILWRLGTAVSGTYTVVAEKAGCTLTLDRQIVPGKAVEFGDLKGFVYGLCAETPADLYLKKGEWDPEATYWLRREDTDTLRYEGIRMNDSILFRGVPAGHDYYVVAANLSCETEKGAYTFDGTPIPVIAAGDFVVEDCRASGDGAVQLKNLKADYEYILTGLTKQYKIMGYQGDSLLNHLDNGTYSYQIRDVKSGCFSEALATTIRRAVPADSISSPMAYCEGQDGVDIELSAKTFGVSYLLKQPDGTVLDSIGSVYESFQTTLTEGQYVFYKERFGLWGGCSEADTFRIEKYPVPSDKPEIIVPEILCEAGQNVIEIPDSQENVWYILRNVTKGMDVDTVYGNGGKVSFTARKPEGTYQLVMKYKGLCETVYYKDFKVNPVPPQAELADCSFCQEEGEAGTCEPVISGLKITAEYILYNAADEPLDTIRGLAAGRFKPQPDGVYRVIGTYPATQCSDRVAEMTVRGVTKPKVFPVSNAYGEGLCEHIADVRLQDGCEGDSVRYTLYINDFFKMAGPVTAENGVVKFGEFKQVGEYKVYAEKGDGACGVWMEGSVIIYSVPPKAQLTVAGVDCGEGTGNEVVITATKTVKDWLYYITDGTEISERLHGNKDGVISWKEIGGHRIEAGEYVLYAVNACDSLLPMDTVEVHSNVAPQKYRLKNIREGYYCKGESYDCILEGSEKGVVYTLELGNGDRWSVDGVGSKDDLFLQSVTTGGEKSELASVYATVDSTGCTYFMDSLRFYWDFYPDRSGVEDGRSICVKEGEEVSLQIELMKPRVPAIYYYLERDGVYVDTIPPDAPASQTKLFKPQTEYGCYTVIAASPTEYCNTREDTICINEPPNPTSGLVGGSQKITLCEGDAFTVEVAKSELGMWYSLVDRNGDRCAAVVKGNGDKLVVGDVTTAGTYYVNVFVSQECSATLEDSVVVKMEPRPLLKVEPYYSYPEGEKGVALRVLPETSEGVYYFCTHIEKPSEQDWKEAHGGQEVYFENPKNDNLFGAGTYAIEASGGGFTCSAYDTIVVEEIKLARFRLEVIGTPYKCEADMCRELKLSGSEKGTNYSLFQIQGADTTFKALMPGTGKPLEFGAQCDTGYFFVMAEKALGDGRFSRARMGDNVHLYVSTAIRKFELKSVIDEYCGDVPMGKVMLETSQDNSISYQLYCNGNPVPGRVLKGTDGGKLAWDNLAGQECVENSNLGNIYTVVAMDDHCEVEMAGSVSIIETHRPTIHQQTQQIDVCTGDQAGLMVDAYGCRLSYQWTRDGEVVGNEWGYPIDSVGMEDMGTYVCTISNVCGSVTSEPIPLKVRQVVTMDGFMEDRLECGQEAQTIELVSKAVGENYAWFKVGGADTDTLSHDRILRIEGATAAKDAGLYRCYTWNSCGGLADTVALEFNRVPEVVLDAPYHIDTLCRGAEFVVQVESRDSLVWFLNDEEMVGKHDRCFRTEAVGPEHEGEYKVKAVNRCNSGFFPLVKLLVDDTIRVLSAPDESKHYCEKSQIRLEIRTAPSERVSYTWYKNRSLKGNSNVWTTVADHTLEDEAWYEVRYQNKCTQGSASQMVYIDRPITLKPIASPDTTCADGSEKQIIVYDQAQTDRSYDTYRWYLRNPQGEPKLVAESDTLSLRREVVNRGVYYAEVSNTCQKITSPEVDVRIDSIPVIQQQLQKATVCELENHTFGLKATGGDLLYQWFLEKKDGTQKNQVWVTEDFASSSQWTLTNLTTDFDSAKVWCVVTNKCGFALSDTVLLRVTTNITLTTDKKIASLCSNAADQVKIAVIPDPQVTDYWNYYLEKDGVIVDQYGPKGVYGKYTDTVLITQPGTYRFYGFNSKTATCVTAGTETFVEVSNRELFYATLSAVDKTTACRLEEVQMKLHIEGGEAPWLVDIRRKKDQQTAPELGGEPIVVYSRDTVFTFSMLSSDGFYLASVSQYLEPEACAGEVSGEVDFTIQQPWDTRFRNISQDRFGACKTLDLAAIFNPTPTVEEGNGIFKIDGLPVVGNTFKGEPGKYKVTYETSTSAGCVDSAVLDIRIDSLPQGRVYTDKSDLCSGEYTWLTAEFKGVGPFKYSLGTLCYDSLGKMTAPPTAWSGTERVQTTYRILYDDMQDKDYKREYLLMKVQDAYGCQFVRDADDTARITLHPSPRFSVAGRHPNYEDFNYTTRVENFEVPATNPLVWFLIQENEQSLPWTYQVVRTGPDGTKDTVRNTESKNGYVTWSTKQSGLYTFTMADAWCPAKEFTQRRVTVLDTGFLRVKVCLEGAFDENATVMRSPVFEKNLVPLKNWKAWPATGERKGIDWVTIEIREKNVNGKLFYSEDFLLLSDGSVVDRYGRETLPIPNVDFETGYYVVVKHRNHLPVGSADAYKLTPAATKAPTVDLRIDRYIYRSVGSIQDHMVFIGIIDNKTIHAMPAGNVFLNALISVENANQAILNERYTPDYYELDVNFDGLVTLPALLNNPRGNNDVTRIFRNRDRYSEIKN